MRRIGRNKCLMGVVLLGAALMAGCGRTQVQHDNRELIESVLTAVSAKNLEWLDANARKIAELRSAEKLSDAEAKAFSDILDQARTGDWDGAADQAYDLRDAQRVTSEDRARVDRHELPTKR